MPAGIWAFGIGRLHTTAEAQSRLAEICDLLGRATSLKFFAQCTLTYRELADSMLRGDMGIAWMPPLVAVELIESGAAVAVAVPARRGMTDYYSALFVPRGGPKTVPELRGKRVAWVAKESAAGYQVARIHLASIGFEPTSFFSRETFLGSHAAVVDAVLTDRADVGATFCSLDPIGKRILAAGWTSADGSQSRPVEMVASGGPIPNDVFVASTKMSAEARAAVSRWFLHADTRGRQLLLQLCYADAFRSALPAHFAPLQRMLAAAKARGFAIDVDKRG